MSVTLIRQVKKKYFLVYTSKQTLNVKLINLKKINKYK